MRTSLLGGLLDVVSHNLARGAATVALFESGRVYLPESPPASGSGDATGGVLDGLFSGSRPAPAREKHRLAALVAGALGAPSWRGEPAPADFYLGKGLLELLCGALRAELELEPTQLPFLHPGRAASVTVGGRAAGWLGELHPRLAAKMDLPASFAFEIDAGALIAASTVGAEIYEDLTSFPAVYEDVAVVIDDSVAAAAVGAAIEEGGGALLHDNRVFDVYEGEQIEPGKRSLALRLEFRASDRTLTDAEVAECRAAIVAALGRLGGVLRG